MAILLKVFGALKYYFTVVRRILSARFSSQANDRTQIEIDVSRHVYHRYLYLLAKLFVISGYAVYINPRLSTLRTMRTCSYSRLLLQTEYVYLAAAPNPSIVLTDKQARFNSIEGRKKLISSDYFSLKKKSKQHLIPICLHPTMYHNHYWDILVEPTTPRINAVILYGNFESSLYRRITESGLFRSANRVDIKNHLEMQPKTLTITDYKALASDELDGRVIIVDSNVVPIPQDQLRPILSRFRYFLAIPGVFMPPCHNIVEALSVGCVPIIENEYLEWLEAPLVDEGAVIEFEGLCQLDQAIDSAFSKSYEDWAQLSNSAESIYKKHFTPQGIVDHVLNSDKSTVALLAGEYALESLKAEMSEKLEDSPIPRIKDGYSDV